MNANIKLLSHDQITWERYPKQYVGCVVLTQDKQIILQQRGEDWSHYPGFLCEFGGRIDGGESPLQALQRELMEELGAKVEAQDAKFIGAILENESQFHEVIHTYFWHDRDNTITGCYEGTLKLFSESSFILSEPNITSGLKWLLNECKTRGYLR